jgi:hypothetical protein
MTPEGKTKNKIKKLLAQHPEAYVYMPVPSGYGMVSLDFLICYRGQFVAIEAKAPGKKPTKLQELTMENMRKAGAVTFVVSDELTLNEFAQFLEAT